MGRYTFESLNETSKIRVRRAWRHVTQAQDNLSEYGVLSTMFKEEITLLDQVRRQILEKIGPEGEP